MEAKTISAMCQALKVLKNALAHSTFSAMVGGMTSHIDLLDRWPSRAELHRDLVAQGANLTHQAVINWRDHGIPARWWTLVVRAAEQRGFTEITLDLLAELAAQAN